MISTEPLSFASTAGVAGAVVSLAVLPLLLELLFLSVLSDGLSVALFDELPPLLPLAAAIIPPTAATPAATHNQFGLNAQNGAATLFPPNACGAKT